MIIGNLATFPPRREGLVQAVQRLAPQLDVLNIVLNEYDAPLSELEPLSNVNQIIPEQDTKDTGKFLPDITGAEFVFLLDDDIVYPPDYVARSLEMMRRLGPGYIGGYHGSIYIRPRPRATLRLRMAMQSVREWWSYDWPVVADFRQTFTFYRALEQAQVVDQLGSGVSVVPGAVMPPFDVMRDSQKFVDVRLSRWCFEHAVKRVVLPRKAGWLQPLRYEETIYQDFTRSNPPEVAREIMTYAFKTPDCGTVPSELADCIVPDPERARKRKKNKMWPFGRKKKASRETFSSADYWRERYAKGGTSGAGSYGRLADYKAGVINALVADRGIDSVIEFGFGDGNQASMFEFPSYTGIDVVPELVARAKTRFADRPGWTFSTRADFELQPAGHDLALSLDVIYHLIEDDVFDAYMSDLVNASGKYLLIYASDRDDMPPAVHVRHRKYTSWIAENAPQWRCIETLENPFAMKEGDDPTQTSFAFFNLFERR